MVQRLPLQPTSYEIWQHSTSVALKHYKDLNATDNLPLS